MIAVALALAAAAVVPQDTGTLDVPVYRHETFGVALPRPFADWVFSPGGSPETITVLFHPRNASLREQLWGALVLTTFRGPIPLEQVADQRVAGTWRRDLGRTFEVLTRDTLSVKGLPALHLVMNGAVNRIAVDVEEYFIARGNDLVIVQFRYPHGLPRDSVAAGYQRAFDGLMIRAPAATPRNAAVEVVPPEEAARRDALANRRLIDSPWRPRVHEATVRLDSGSARADFTVRLEFVNGDVEPRDSVAFALRGPFVLDGARTATGQALLVTAGAALSTAQLPAPVEPQGATALTITYHLAAPAPADSGVALGAEGMRCFADWLPRVTAWEDSAGHRLESPHPRRTVRFDVPESYAAVSAGHLAADFTALGRRRMTWVADQEPSPEPLFVIGHLERGEASTRPNPSVRVWAAATDSARSSGDAARLGETVRSAWGFFASRFGRLDVEAVDVVSAAGGGTRLAGGTLFLAAGASDDSVRTAVARAWWGSTVRFTGPGAAWLADALPAWSALLYRAATEGDTTRQRLVREAEASHRPVAAIEAARRATGDALFRSSLRAFFLDHRRTPATLVELLSLLGPAGAAALEPYLLDH